MGKGVLRSSVRVAAAVLSLWTFGACAVGPDYVPPDISAPRAWHTELRGGVVSEASDPRALAEWWETLEDPVLSSLIGQAVEGNLDLEQARARVREARARLGITRAGLFPTLEARGSGNVNHKRLHEGESTESWRHSEVLDAGWELDLFGGTRRSVEASEADLEAGREDLRDVLVSLLSETALSYVEIRVTQARLMTAEANLKAQEDTWQMAQWRFEAGLTTQLDVEQARYNLESTRSQIPPLRSSLEAARNRIAVLLGERPGEVHPELDKPAAVPVPPLGVAVGVPADLLRRRPDIRRAERRLAAQTARIGEATAELYPKFSLLGSIGLETLSTAGLSSAASRAATLGIGPSVSWAIFRAGAVRKNIEVQNALQEQALVQYESTLLSALEEVENALTAYAEEQERRKALAEAARAAGQAAELAREKYRAGLIDFSDVLEAERSLLSLQDREVESRGAVTANLVRLYKALGGGWTSRAPEDGGLSRSRVDEKIKKKSKKKHYHEEHEEGTKGTKKTLKVDKNEQG